MDVLPSIDLRGGQVVRLAQGDYDRQTVYSADPSAVAREFASAGARWIHVVDLDAALSGERTNAEAIRGVCRAVDAAVELGGGIRDDAAVVSALELGVRRVIIGSAALKDWAWFERLAQQDGLAGKVVLGLDARGEIPAVHGWTEQTELTVAEVARRAGSLPLAAIVYTDIDRDGMLTGPNLEMTVQVAEISQLPVIASGGVSGIEDVVRCMQAGCAGVIVGRAWYEGRIDLAQACRLGAG
ncbi:hypothetical protein LCGC14_2993190 [marine sediment metagenome]|uniref:1-(5-phosphoribosyl)-5-[(5-phosphoribosylamino)methylideneamino]imidazole-4-carboxamideisomerase n=1 Tax=marine sediment metagenome TaxID=412755 RepID=A0A0F8X370_9ZZZZ